MRRILVTGGAGQLGTALVREWTGRAILFPVGPTHFDLRDAAVPVAIAARWEGSATYARIKAFCAGAVQAMQSHLAQGHPLILVFDSDIGGLLGLHFREEMRLPFPIISIDGVELREFDYIDIGAFIPTSGAVPVVIKSLVFPRST